MIFLYFECIFSPPYIFPFSHFLLSISSKENIKEMTKSVFIFPFLCFWFSYSCLVFIFIRFIFSSYSFSFISPLLHEITLIISYHHSLYLSLLFFFFTFLYMDKLFSPPLPPLFILPSSPFLFALSEITNII